MATSKVHWSTKSNLRTSAAIPCGSPKVIVTPSLAHSGRDCRNVTRRRRARPSPTGLPRPGGEGRQVTGSPAMLDHRRHDGHLYAELLSQRALALAWPHPRPRRCPVRRYECHFRRTPQERGSGASPSSDPRSGSALSDCFRVRTRAQVRTILRSLKSAPSISQQDC